MARAISNPVYLDREETEAFLKNKGFNGLDIECILDLAGPVLRNGKDAWPVDRVERLASRAYWLGENEVHLALLSAAA
jgi:hypothetical protein